MTNKFLRHDGVNWSLDQGLTGPPGPSGPAGLDGPAGAAGDASLIYRPGSTPSGSIFASWNALMVKRATIDGPVTIVIDDSIVTPAPIEGGAWDLTHNTRLVGYKGNQIDGATLTQLTIPDGANLLNPCYFADLNITGHSVSSPSIDGDTMNFEAHNTIFQTERFATQPLIHTNGGIMDFYGDCRLVTSSNAAYIISNQSSTPVTINLRDNTTVDGYTLKFDNATYTVTINVSDNASFNSNQIGISIAVIINQSNIIQAAPHDLMNNPNIVAVRQNLLQSTTTALNGAVNLGSDTSEVSTGVEAEYSTVSGGDQNAIGPGGVLGTIPGGFGGQVIRYGQYAYSSSVFANNAPGYSQFSRYFVRGAYTGVTPIVLTDGGGGSLLLETNKTYAITATCIINRVGGLSERRMFIYKFLAYCVDTGPIASIVGLTLDYSTTYSGATETLTFVPVGATIEARLANIVPQTQAFLSYEWIEIGGSSDNNS